jgi:hypothetical protein
MAARTFFGDSDYALYRDLLAENCHAAGRRRVGMVPDAEPRAPSSRIR